MHNLKTTSIKVLLLFIFCANTKCLLAQEYQYKRIENYSAIKTMDNQDSVRSKMELQLRPGIKLSEDKKHNLALSAALSFPLGKKWRVIPGIAYWKERDLFGETSSCFGIFLLFDYNIYIKNFSIFIGTGGGQYKFSNHSGTYWGLILDTGAAYRINKKISISAGINYPVVLQNSEARSAVLPIVFIGANLTLGANK